MKTYRVRIKNINEIGDIIDTHTPYTTEAGVHALLYYSKDMCVYHDRVFDEQFVKYSVAKKRFSIEGWYWLPEWIEVYGKEKEDEEELF